MADSIDIVQPEPERRTCHLRIMATTDLHMHLSGHNYYADKPDLTAGLTRTATLIRQAREEAEQQGHIVLLLDNGDSLQGNPMADLATSQNILPHPAMRAFDVLNYDAIGLGNHDFDFGPERLFDILKDAPCPVLCSNVRGDVGPIQRSVTLRRSTGNDGELVIGLIALAPPQTSAWNKHLLGGQLRFCDMVSAAKQEAERLKAEGCDLVIALAHTGFTRAPVEACAENAAAEIAKLDAIDVIIAGHTHLHLPGPEHAGIDGLDANRGLAFGKPAVMPGSSGSHLGLIDLSLAFGEERWRPTLSSVHLMSVSRHDAASDATTSTGIDHTLARELAPYHVQTRQSLTKVISSTSQPLHSFFSLFGPDRSLALVASAQATAVINALGETSEQMTPLLSAVAPNKTGGLSGPDHYTNVPAGPMTMGHLADLHIYNDQLRLIRLTGDKIADWLEQSASIFDVVKSGSANQWLIPWSSRGYFFDVIHGLDYAFDLSKPPRYDPFGNLIDPMAKRVSHLRYKGAPIVSEQECYVILGSYRCNGGGNFSALNGARQLPLPEIRLRQAIKDFLANDTVTIRYTPPWRFVDLSGATVQVATNPAARHHLNEISHLAPQDLGVSENGFLNLRLSL